MTTKIAKLEDKVYDAQYEWIEKVFDREAADAANYGWGVDCGRDRVQVSSKIYGHGILTTTAVLGGEIEHDFRGFD